MEEFSNSVGWKIFYSILAIFMIGFSLFLLNIGNSKAGNRVLAIPAFLVLFAVLLVVNKFRSKIIISADSIISINMFGFKELNTANIKGCRFGEKVIYIVPNSSSDPQITIRGYSDLSNSEYLAKWLRENFKDLDAEDLTIEQNKLLQDGRLGSTQEEREEKIKRIKQLAMTYNITGMILGIAAIFFDNYFVTIILISFPLMGILLMIFSKGLVKFVSSKRSAYSYTMLGFLLPSFTMLIKSFSEYEISQYENLWLPFIIVTILLLTLLYFIGINRSAESIAGQVAIMLIACLIYGYGGIIQINCKFDRSKPQLIHTSVYSKWKEYSKGEHYHLKLNTWDADGKLKDIEVSKATFDEFSEGSKIGINLKRGLLNIPWFYLQL